MTTFANKRSKFAAQFNKTREAGRDAKTLMGRAAKAARKKVAKKWGFSTPTVTPTASELLMQRQIYLEMVGDGILSDERVGQTSLYETPTDTRSTAASHSYVDWEDNPEMAVHEEYMRKYNKFVRELERYYSKHPDERQEIPAPYDDSTTRSMADSEAWLTSTEKALAKSQATLDKLMKVQMQQSAVLEAQRRELAKLKRSKKTQNLWIKRRLAKKAKQRKKDEFLKTKRKGLATNGTTAKGTAAKKMESSDSSTADDEGHLKYQMGDIIHDRYQIVRELGEGQFSKVCAVKDLQDPNNPQYALKIIRNIPKYREAAEDEMNVLKKLQTWDQSGRYSCIQMLDWFDYIGHICIVFELLGKSVYDFLKDNQYHPYPMRHIRHILYQLCYAVKFLHDNKCTHTDLKPENMLLVNSSYVWENDPETNEEYKVLKDSTIRLCDFGSAVFDDEHHSTVIQTRHYRAPEVILELGWSQPCDVWSVGCILFEIYDGDPLYLTHDTREHLAMMQRVMGTIPFWMAKQSKTRYFKDGVLAWDPNSSAGKKVREKVKRLNKYMRRNTEEHKHVFELMERMCDYNPKSRITMAESLDHVYFRKLPASVRKYDEDRRS